MQLMQYLLPAAFSFLAVYLAAKISAASQLRDRAIDVYLTARLKAYQGFEEAIRQWTLEKSAQNAATVFQLANEACMVSSDATGDAISKVASMINSYMAERSFDLPTFQRLRLDCFQHMREDLASYPVPDPTEFWFTRLFRRLKLLLRSCKRRR